MVMIMNLKEYEKILFYVIKRLGKRVDGRKKLMKIMFLINHWNPETKSLEKEPFLGDEFMIYHYGVFSWNVMNVYLNLCEKGIVKEYPIEAVGEMDNNIEDNIKERIDLVIKEFGRKYGNELEDETLKMLGISKENKMNFFGKPVVDLIRI